MFYRPSPLPSPLPTALPTLVPTPLPTIVPSLAPTVDDFVVITFGFSLTAPYPYDASSYYETVSPHPWPNFDFLSRPKLITVGVR